MKNTNDYMGLIAFILILVGAINWGLVGLANFDLVKFLFGELTLTSRAVYSLVGVSGIYLLITRLYTQLITD